MKRAVIYTALTGEYDLLLQPESVRDDFEYVCFSDRDDIPDRGVWHIRPIQYSNPDCARVSRFPKINPHVVLPEFEASLYVDANISIRAELYSALDRALDSGCDIAMVKHPERDDVYDEALALLGYGLGEPKLIYRQVRDLLAEGYPRHAGLFVCSVIFRRHCAESVRKFDETWWKLFSSNSKRDQLSVMPALCAASLAPEELIGTEYVTASIHPHAGRKRESPSARIRRFVQRTIVRAILVRKLKGSSI